MMILLCILSFIFGAIPWGYIIGKSKGIDLRKVGSGNIGATNVLRVIGKKEALITLLLDISKGFIPVIIARMILNQSPINSHETFMIGLVGIFAILGHCFSPFLKFKGGKGVATSIGVLFAYIPFIGLFTVIIWILTFKISKISSLGALISFALLPLNVYLFGYQYEVLIVAFLITTIIYIKHIPNIKRLLQGKELKIGEKK